MDTLLAQDQSGVQKTSKLASSSTIVEAGEEISFEDFDDVLTRVTQQMADKDSKLYVSDGFMYVSPSCGKTMASELVIEKEAEKKGAQESFLCVGRIIADCPLLNGDLTKKYVVRSMEESVPPPLTMYVTREGKPFTGVQFELTDDGDIVSAVGIACGVNTGIYFL